MRTHQNCLKNVERTAAKVILSPSTRREVRSSASALRTSGSNLQTVSTTCMDGGIVQGCSWT